MGFWGLGAGKVLREKDNTNKEPDRRTISKKRPRNPLPGGGGNAERNGGHAPPVGEEKKGKRLSNKEKDAT